MRSRLVAHESSELLPSWTASGYHLLAPYVLLALVFIAIYYKVRIQREQVRPTESSLGNASVFFNSRHLSNVELDKRIHF